MNDDRPDPDELLARTAAEAERARRGRLKIFFGFAPGVGKTFAMLQDARSRRDEGADVVAGVVETHRRAETEALLEGLEILPRREVAYHGVTLREFDLDGALARRPALVLVDELAHTNAPGSRHSKRWQDVEELLASGIDVHTTLNVQHVESLSDVVAQITGAIVRETVPDSILERADEIELTDLPPEQLLERLNEGKVYVPEQAGRALESFFRKGNLIALRELSLRRTAERVAAQMVDYRRDRSIRKVWPAAERLLVAVGPSPSSLRLVRATKRMAESQHADWFAISIETPAYDKLALEDRERVARTLQAAEQLGARTATVGGERTSEAILKFAREQNVTKIVVGKPLRIRMRERIFGSIVDELIRECGEIDVYVISGEGDEAPASPPRRRAVRADWLDWAYALAAVAAASGLAAAMFRHFEPANLAMVYLLAVVATAAFRGRRASIAAACMSVAVFDFCFVPPYWTFAVTDSQYVVTFAVMLVVGLTISNLTARVRDQARRTAGRERTTWILFDLSRNLARARGVEEIANTATRHAERILQGKVSVLLPDDRGRIGEAGTEAADTCARGVARWVMDHGRPAGMGTDTLASAEALYLPIRSPEKTYGVLRLQPETAFRILDPERLRFMSTLTSLIALALEREALAEQAQAARADMEAERMRNVLLSSVSHDLRTPLTVIAGAASALVGREAGLDEETRREFARTICDEATRLDRLVSQILEMSRLEAGNVKLERDWHVLEEVVGSALNRLDALLADRDVSVRIDPALPLLWIDDALMEQVVANLVENAIKHTPAGSPIEIVAKPEGKTLRIEVLDRGSGLPAGREAKVFEKFHQVDRTGASRGVGLGLTICKYLVEAHGGTIAAGNRPGGGAVFSIRLPLEDGAPSLPAPGEGEEA